MTIQSRPIDPCEGEERQHPRVLIVAENASLSQGGESYLPVQWLRGLVKEGVDVRLLVHARSKPDLENLLGEFGSCFHFVPEVLAQTIFWKIGAALPAHVRDFTSGWFVQLISQIMQRRVARGMIEQYGIEVVHQLTPVSPRLPSMLYGLGVPVIIGPMNGNMTYPPQSVRTRPILERGFVPVARSFTNIANYIIPGKRRADVLLVANERTRMALPSGCQGSVGMVCENGVDPTVWRLADDAAAPPANRLRLAFMGRLERWKGADVALDVLYEVKQQRPEAELWIIGNGPELQRLKRQAEKLGVVDAVTFHGWVPKNECPVLLSQTDVMLFPSLHDCGGAVVLEAMALGLPVVALNWGGPGDYLADGGGVLIEPAGRSQTVAAFVEAVRCLTPSKRHELSKIAKRIISEHYTWPGKIRQILDVYRSVCSRDKRVSARDEPCL
ncbi:MAG: glycosyltransferase family 4 protein [Novosphingobium sp.]